MPLMKSIYISLYQPPSKHLSILFFVIILSNSFFLSYQTGHELESTQSSGYLSSSKQGDNQICSLTLCLLGRFPFYCLWMEPLGGNHMLQQSACGKILQINHLKIQLNIYLSFSETVDMDGSRWSKIVKFMSWDSEPHIHLLT